MILQNPVVFEAYGFDGGEDYAGVNYTMPIVMGSARMSSSAWSPVSGTAHVYRQPWPSSYINSNDVTTSMREMRVWVDNTHLGLRQPAGCAGGVTCPLSTLDSTPDSFASQNGMMYVNLQNQPDVTASIPITLGTALTSDNPANYTIEVPYQNTFYFNANGNPSAVSHVIVQGFKVWYSDYGIAFTDGASYDTAQYNDVSYNFDMGMEAGANSYTCGYAGGCVSSYDTFQYNTCEHNTLQCVKLDGNSMHALVQYNIGDEGGFLETMFKIQGGVGTNGYQASDYHIIQYNQCLDGALIPTLNWPIVR